MYYFRSKQTSVRPCLWALLLGKSMLCDLAYLYSGSFDVSPDRELLFGYIMDDWQAESAL